MTGEKLSDRPFKEPAGPLRTGGFSLAGIMVRWLLNDGEAAEFQEIASHG